MLICVAGKNDIAVDVLEYLLKNNRGRYDLCIVCDKTETGENAWQKSLRWFAEKNDIPEVKLQELYEVEDLIFLSTEFDQIIRPHLFKTNKFYNIHFSLLPSYKGMYPSVLPILNGEKYVGVTLHEMDSRIDAGNIIAQKRFILNEEVNCRDLYVTYMKEGAELVIDNLESIISGNYKSYPQGSEGSTYHAMGYIDYANLKINLRQTAETIRRQIRAFSFREYQLPKVYEKSIISAFITSVESKGKAGEIIFENHQGMMLSTIDYNVFLFYDRFEELQEACRAGDLSLVMDICTERRHINEKNDRGWTPLIIATYNNQKEIVEYLIENGGDLYVKNNNGTNLLMYAKDAFLNTGDLYLFKLYVKLGLSPYEQDLAGKNLFDYLNDLQDEKREELLICLNTMI